MIIFLVIVSLMFNSVNLLIIVILWKKHSVSDVTDLNRARNEIEDLLLAYTTEMKEENEQLLQSLKDRSYQDVPKQTFDNIQEIKDESIEYKEDSLEINEETTNANVEIQSTTQYKKSIREEAVSLAKQGISVEDIAKRLNKGKGEIELFLKFYKE
jgi:spermidine/putrescine-binding protein